MDVWSGVPHEVVLCNFGGPTRREDVQPFLLKLFEDPFIIRAPIGPGLRGVLARRIARKRADKAAHEYEKIGFSPINRYTDVQAKHLEKLLRETRPDTRVHVCNRYTAPSADEVVARLDTTNSRLFLITLYPHLCHSTTVSSLRDFDLALERRLGHRDVPSTRVFSWWQTPRYLELTFAQLRTTLTDAVAASDGKVTVLFSAHGIPLRYHRRGDPYVTETQAHFAELRRRGDAWLATHDGGRHAGRVAWELSFQSRVGPVEWVKPYTDERIAALGKGGGALVVVPISFTSDHIETLFEMDHTYRELAKNSGFTGYFRVVPANDDPELARCLADALLNHGF